MARIITPAVAEAPTFGNQLVQVDLQHFTATCSLETIKDGRFKGDLVLDGLSVSGYVVDYLKLGAKETAEVIKQLELKLQKYIHPF